MSCGGEICIDSIYVEFSHRTNFIRSHNLKVWSASVGEDSVKQESRYTSVYVHSARIVTVICTIGFEGKKEFIMRSVEI